MSPWLLSWTAAWRCPSLTSPSLLQSSMGEVLPATHDDILTQHAFEGQLFVCVDRCSSLRPGLLTANGGLFNFFADHLKLMYTSLDLQLCRYEEILSSVLEHLSCSNELPAALLEHVIIGRVVGSTGRFRAASGKGAETIDLLMCAASVASVSTVQALIDCGAPGAQHLSMLFKRCREAQCRLCGSAVA